MASDCSGCEWTNNECKRYDTSIDSEVLCPVDCFLPYPNEYFNSEVVPTLESTGNDVTMEAAQEFINFHSNSENKNPTDMVQSADSFNCGPTFLQEGDRLPEIPSKEMLYSLLSDDKNSAFYSGPIKWDKIKPNDFLDELISKSTDISDISYFSGNIDIDGVDLSWYTNNANLLTKEEVSDMNVEIIPEYSETTGIFKRTIFDPLINNVISGITFDNGITSDIIINNINNENKILLQATEVRRSYNEQMEYLRGIKMSNDIKNIEQLNIDSDLYNITKLVHFFTLTEEDKNNEELIIKFNKLLNTNDNDSEYINRINGYTSLEQLGDNYEDLKYIERKIRKFLGTNIEKFVDIFININYRAICDVGFSHKPIKILLHLLELNMNDKISQEKLMNRKRALKIIYKYVPNLMKKILDISKRLETTKCDKITKKTQTYNEMYNDLFINSNVLKFSLPDLGISDFFKDFTHNIYTKIVLLIFIAFIFSKIVSLFSLNIKV